MRLHMCASCSRRPAAAPPPAQPARLRVVVSADIGKRRETSGAHAPLRRFAASRLCCAKLAGGTRKTRAVKEFNVQCKVNLNFYTFIVQFTVVWMYSVMVMWLFETFYSRNIAFLVDGLILFITAWHYAKKNNNTNLQAKSDKLIEKEGWKYK